jgi:hypothetical protein
VPGGVPGIDEGIFSTETLKEQGLIVCTKRTASDQLKL